MVSPTARKGARRIKQHEEGESDNKHPAEIGTAVGNIRAAKHVSQMLESTHGPFGRSKILEDHLGRFHVSNSGYDILDWVDFKHPVGSMMKNLATNQHENHRDGTTTAVLLAGNLLKESEFLMDDGLHPTTIYQGYNHAKDIVKEVFANETIEVEPDNRELLIEIARSSLVSTGLENPDNFVEPLVEAVQKLVKAGLDPKKYLTIETVVGSHTNASHLTYGLVLHKKPGHPEMPTRVDDPRIALIDFPIASYPTVDDNKNPKIKPKVASPDDIEEFTDREKSDQHQIADKIIETGANVVICNHRIDTHAYSYLTENGVFSLRRAKSEVLDHIANVTDAEWIVSMDDLDSSKLGSVDLVKQEVISGNDYVIFEAGIQKGATFVVHTTIESNKDRFESALETTVTNLTSAMETGIVPGGGAIEMRVAQAIRQRASELSNREQLATLAFADAIESVPITLARNAGHRPLDALSTLRYQHGNGMMSGVTTPEGNIDDVLSQGIYDSSDCKQDSITGGIEFAVQILRIDRVIATRSEFQDDEEESQNAEEGSQEASETPGATV